MPGDTLPPPLVDAIRSSALKLKERQTALDARARELEAYKARLEQERAELEARTARIAADREALDKERQGLEDVKASMARDLAALNETRDRLTKDEEEFRRASQGIDEREKLLRGNEDRVSRLAQEFTAQMKDSESKLHDLLERGEALTKLQTDWLAAVEARGKELRTLGEEMNVRQTEIVRQYESLGSLKGILKDELQRLLAEHEILSTKEKTILEAEKYLASALQIEATALDQDDAPAPAPTPPPAPEPAVLPPAPEPTPPPEAPAAQEAVPVQEEIVREPEPKPKVTKEQVTERLSKAVEAWKRARDAGWKVGDIRKTVKAARDAIEDGDYDRATGLVVEILEGLQATAPAR